LSHRTFSAGRSSGTFGEHTWYTPLGTK
jgi:hypothetical protein